MSQLRLKGGNLLVHAHFGRIWMEWVIDAWIIEWADEICLWMKKEAFKGIKLVPKHSCMSLGVCNVMCAWNSYCISKYAASHFYVLTNFYSVHLSIVIVHSFHAVLDYSAPELRLLLYPFSVSEEVAFAMARDQFYAVNAGIRSGGNPLLRPEIMRRPENLVCTEIFPIRMPNFVFRFEDGTTFARRYDSSKLELQIQCFWQRESKVIRDRRASWIFSNSNQVSLRYRISWS